MSADIQMPASESFRLGLVAAFCLFSACAAPEEVAGNITLSYRLNGDDSEGTWHNRALASKSLTYNGEGCIISVSEDQFMEIYSLFAASEKVTIGNRKTGDSLIRFTASSSWRFDIWRDAVVRDIDGRYFNVSNEVRNGIISQTDELLRPFDCPISEW